MTWPLHSLHHHISSFVTIPYDSYQKPCDVGSGFHLPVLLLCRWFGPWSRPKILGAWRHLNMKLRRKRQNKTHCDHCAFSKLIEVIDELQSFGSLGRGPVRLLTRQDFFSWWSWEKRNGPLSSTVSTVPTCFNPWFGYGRYRLGGFSKEMVAVIYTRTPVWMTDPPWISGLKLQQSKVPRIDSGKKSKSCS